jgi:hypothetical protein
VLRGQLLTTSTVPERLFEEVVERTPCSVVDDSIVTVSDPGSALDRSEIEIYVLRRDEPLVEATYGLE